MIYVTEYPTDNKRHLRKGFNFYIIKMPGWEVVEKCTCELSAWSRCAFLNGRAPDGVKYYVNYSK